MAPLTSPDGSYTLTRPCQWLPVTRQLSYPLTHILYRLPISPNQVTGLSMIAGLVGVRCLAQVTWSSHIWGGFWLMAFCTLDNCDGEIARLKAMSSEWGAHFDDFVDWLVDSGLVAALGYGTWQTSVDTQWMWPWVRRSTKSSILYYMLVPKMIPNPRREKKK